MESALKSYVVSPNDKNDFSVELMGPSTLVDDVAADRELQGSILYAVYKRRGGKGAGYDRKNKQAFDDPQPSFGVNGLTLACADKGKIAGCLVLKDPLMPALDPVIVFENDYRDGNLTARMRYQRLTGQVVSPPPLPSKQAMVRTGPASVLSSMPNPEAWNAFTQKYEKERAIMQESLLNQGQNILKLVDMVADLRKELEQVAAKDDGVLNVEGSFEDDRNPAPKRGRSPSPKKLKRADATLKESDVEKKPSKKQRKD